ncbi:MAG TPA: GNVR domain-containing protein [Vicinamibacterales bacterium]|nr:GNVR domain-containing protein [Vicinamibacterales bacterium]
MLPGRELTLDVVFGALRRWWWLLVLPLFAGIMGGLLYSRSQPSLYRSDALIQVVPQRVPETYVSATVTERVEDRLRALAQQVLSRTQLEKLITDFSLFPREREKYPMEDVVELMTKRVLIQPLVAGQVSRRDSQSEAFRVSFDYQDPVIAQKVVERLASFFIDTNARDRGTQADQTSAFLEAQLADARSRLEAQEQRLKVFRERNAGRLPTQTQTNMQAIQNTQMALQSMVASLEVDRNRKLVLERLYNDAAADEPVAAPVPAGASGALPADAPPQQRLAAARAALAQMETRLSPKHPDIVRTRRVIADLEQQVAAAELERPVSPEAGQAVAANQEEARRRERLREMRAEIESLDRQIAFKEGEERRMRAEIGAYQARLEAVPGIESEWIALTRDYDTLQETYRQLLAKSENSKMAASLEQRQIGEQFRILDPPRVPQKPTSPNRLRINLLGLLAGLGLGVALVGLFYVRDSTMRSEGDVLGAIDLPVLGLLPYVTTDADVRRRKRLRLLAATAAALLAAASGGVFWVLRLWRYVA